MHTESKGDRLSHSLFYLSCLFHKNIMEGTTHSLPPQCAICHEPGKFSVNNPFYADWFPLKQAGDSTLKSTLYEYEVFFPKSFQNSVH